MAESPGPPPSDGVAPDVEPDGAAPERPRRSRVRRVLRAVRRTFVLLLAILLAIVVAVVSIDLGPALRHQAERGGSALINRPLHIGRLSIRLLTGRFVLENLVIEGLSPKDRPFFEAKKLEVSMGFGALLHREVYIEQVALEHWRMIVETWPDGHHSFIKLPQRSGGGPKRFTTTVQLVRATRGEFVFEDHGVPWGVVAPNLDLTIAHTAGYGGQARFSGGTVRLQQFEPMWANMSCDFTIDGGLVRLSRIDLQTDGAQSAVTGVVDIGHWPEQTYQVSSRIHFPRIREIFWANEHFSLAGDGQFNGTFHLFKGGRDLHGEFASADAGVNAFRFPKLRGNVQWLPDRLEVRNATSQFQGGTTAFSFRMAPLGKPGTPAVATLDASYDRVDLAAFTDFMELRGLRLSGRASGRNLLRWPLGRWSEHAGDGRVRAAAPEGVAVLGRDLPPDIAEEHARLGPEVGPFNPQPLQGYLPVAGDLTYRYGPDWIDVAPSHIETRRTYVEFAGRTAYGRQSALDFHVTSASWQESDRVLAAMMQAFGKSTRAIPIGGYGTFDGTVVGNLNSPRISGRFAGGAIRAFDVTWGQGDADVVIENAYVDVGRAVMTKGENRMNVDGRFSIGFPRDDGGEEINARIAMERWDVAELRHAFGLDDYPVTGALSGEFHVYDRYERPLGFGRMRLEPGVAYGQHIDRATASLRFEGKGVRLDAIDAAIGRGTLTGAAYVGWDGSYSFNADGRRMALEDLDSLKYPQAPLSGQLEMSASGTGTFSSPRYELRGRVDDLFVGDEGVGLLRGHLVVRDRQLTIDQFEIASPRLAVSGGGRIALTPEADAELTFRFSDTSIDPYVRALQPALSPFTTAVASGTVHVIGELRNLDALHAQAQVDELDLRLFDYRVRNDGPLNFSLERQTVHVDQFRLVGDGTQIEMAGDVRLAEQRISLRALGDANLGILQGFLRDIRSSGSAELQADVSGPLSKPLALGSLTITNGRVRHFALPHAIDALNGRIEFDAGGIHLRDLTGKLGGGDVRFDGRIGFVGFSPTDYSITMRGDGMRLRYPEGLRSLIDADLALRGPFATPTLSGTVNVRSSSWNGGFDTGGTGIFGIAAGGANGRVTTAAVADSRIPVRFDIHVLAPSTLKIENRSARLVSSADLTLRGTVDRPALFGHVEIERGEVFFEGNRYEVTRGSIDFANPTRIEPFFDIEAETRARAPGQIYQVVFHVSGTPDRFVFDLTSDPPLATVEILSLLFGDVRDPRNADLQALRTPNRTEQDLLAARAARLLASPLSSEVGRVVEQTLGVDTVQISPSLGDLTALETLRFNPSARLTIGKRLSERLYLTYARALSTTTSDQIIVLEYTQSDRLSWVLSQNEDRTYAVDVRVRYVF